MFWLTTSAYDFFLSMLFLCDISPSFWVWLLSIYSVRLVGGKFWIIGNLVLDDDMRSRWRSLILLYLWAGLSFGVLILSILVDLICDSWCVIFVDEVWFGGSLVGTFWWWWTGCERYRFIISWCYLDELWFASANWLRGCRRLLSRYLRWVWISLFGCVCVWIWCWG